MNRRRQRLFPPAPDFLYKAASFEPYNSAKYPEKPLATGAFCPDGVKNSLPELYQFLVGMVAPQVRLELTTLRLTAECSAIELLRIIRGLFAARCLPPARSSASSSLLRSALATASARTSLSARSALTTALASLLARLPFAAPFFLMFESGKNFRSSRSLWIPATSYSPKPFPAQYHQRLEA